jgi:hypothetical protein
MKDAIMIYPHGKDFKIPFDDNQYQFLHSALSYVWQECQGGIAEILERPTELDKLNANGARLRSSMVGDIIVIDNRCFIVDGVGFVEVDRKLADRWVTLPHRDIIMGWEWCRSRHNLGLPIQLIN